MTVSKRYWLFLFFLALLLTSASLGDVGPTLAILNCKIFPVSSPAIENGVIIIRDGLIEAIGPLGKVKIPEDAETIDAKGLAAYPGLISSHTNLFIEAPKEEATQGPLEFMMPAPSQEAKPSQAPELMVLNILKPKKSTVENFHKIGITTVLVAPNKGIFEGQSVLLNLNGEKIEPMVLKNPVALHINFTTERGTYPSSLMGTIAFIRQSFLDAGYYAAYESQYNRVIKGIKRPEYNPYLEALLPFVQEKKPIVFQCNNQENIKYALKLIAEFKLNALLSQVNEAWRISPLLKKAKIPLLVTLDFKPPQSSQYVNQGEELKKKAEAEIYPANAANLYKEGIMFSLTSFGLSESSILNNIRAAIKAGLPREEALRAMTIHPAQYLGVQRQLGSLEPGKIANVILLKGEIFDEKSKVEKVFVDGIPFLTEEKGK